MEHWKKTKDRFLEELQKIDNGNDLFKWINDLLMSHMKIMLIMKELGIDRK